MKEQTIALVAGPPQGRTVTPVPSSPHVGPDGEFFPMGGGPTATPPEPDPPTFREFHDAYRKRNRMGRILHNSSRQDRTKEDDARGGYPGTGRTYVREHREGEIKGKAAIKAAKRERVNALKAQAA